VFHCDARKLPLDPSSIDLIVTSPPYINVFNYHQNYRPAMELLGWDMLQVAKSEFGSNRKHRGNRFLTAVQYTIDMLEALAEMRRIIRPGGRVIIVVGRESTIRGVSLQNGRIVAALALGGANFRLALRQERKFKTKYGETIYEDILHLVPGDQALLPLDQLGYRLAHRILAEVVDKAKDDVRADIAEAIQQTSQVETSPYFSIPGSLCGNEKGRGQVGNAAS
jgi:SAM-dependent methyltransferase